MINAIINGVMNLIISLVNLILSPIDLLINQYIPSLSDAFNYINNFFELLGSIVPWVVSYLGITPSMLAIYVDLIVFIFTVPYLVHAIKLAIKWYNSLKL